MQVIVIGFSPCIIVISYIQYNTIKSVLIYPENSFLVNLSWYNTFTKLVSSKICSFKKKVFLA